MSDPIDVTPEPASAPTQPEMALTTRPALPATATRTGVLSATEAKQQAINDLSQSAYAKASSLKLTAEEIRALQEDFPDEAFRPGAGGKQALIYIEHAYLRERLNKVLGPCQWAIVKRQHWTEEFSYYDTQTRSNQTAVRVYVEAFLMVRECFVAEAIGDMVYYPKNQQTNYGDAVEGAKSSALRRCVKEMGVGLQVWKKEFSEAWWARQHGSITRPPTNRPMTAASAPASQSKPAAPSPASPTLATLATQTHKARMIELLNVSPDYASLALDYARAASILLPNEDLSDWPMSMVPLNKTQMDELTIHIKSFERGDPASKPFPPNPTAPQPEPSAQAASAGRDEPWRSFIVPFGKMKDKTLGECGKNFLWGLWANYKVETTYNGKPLSPARIAADQLFRNMLDQAGKHYEFKPPKDAERESEADDDVPM